MFYNTVEITERERRQQHPVYYHSFLIFILKITHLIMLVNSWETLNNIYIIFIREKT